MQEGNTQQGRKKCAFQFSAILRAIRCPRRMSSFFLDQKISSTSCVPMALAGFPSSARLWLLRRKASMDLPPGGEPETGPEAFFAIVLSFCC